MPPSPHRETLGQLKERVDWLHSRLCAEFGHHGLPIAPDIAEAIAEVQGYLQELHLTQAGGLHDHARLKSLAELSLLTKDLPSLFEKIVRVTSTLLPASAGSSVVLWDEEDQTFRRKATTISAQDPDVTRVENEVTRWVTEHKRPYSVPDVSHNSFETVPLLARLGLGAFIAAPLLVAGEVFGVLYAFDTKPRVYSAEDHEFMMMLAGRVARAAQLTQLLETTQETLSNAKALQRVSSSLILPADSLNASGLLELQGVVDNIVRALAAKRVLLLTFDMSAKQLVYFVVGGEAASSIRPEPFERYQAGLTGWVMRERRAIFSSKEGVDPRESPLTHELRVNRKIGSIVIAPIMYEQKVYGTLTAVRDIHQDDFEPENLTSLEDLAKQAAITLRNGELYEEAKYLATVDHLTGSFNRRHLFELGERELKRHQRLHHPLAVVMLDIDYFKRVNDHYGHAVGDEVLRLLCERVTMQTREIDILGRYGGEEFALLLPETELREALEIAERLRRTALETFHVAELELSISISLGVAAAQGDTSLSHLLQRADAALYEAKRAGRNRVVAFENRVVEAEAES
ncbi:MAG: diguanylate cyclase [Trueperaceae bacterium]